jgi:hypothetical protein
MKIFKLDVNDLLDDDFVLLAIHTTLEAYRLAYFMNITFDIQLIKTEVIQDFDFYEFNDEKNQSLWNLVGNKAFVENKTGLKNNESMFFESKNNRIFLLPEYKKVDYFLKIENSVSVTKNLILKMNDIPQIITTFAVDVVSLKSKNNLIFY